MIDVACEDLFGGHVEKCPHSHSGLCFAFGADQAGNSEVCQLHFALGADEDVGGFDVAMDHVLTVNVSETCKSMNHDRNRFFQREPFLLSDHVFDVVAFDVLHDEITTMLVFEGVFPLNDIGVFQGGEGFGFCKEAIPQRRVGHEFAVEHLDGDGLFRHDVNAVKDLPHATGPQRPEHAILSAYDRGLWRVRHRTFPQQ